MIVIKTARGVTTRVSFLFVILTSLGSKSGTPLYLIHRRDVNTILNPFATHPLSLEAHAGTWIEGFLTAGVMTSAAPNELIEPIAGYLTW